MGRPRPKNNERNKNEKKKIEMKKEDKYVKEPFKESISCQFRRIPKGRNFSSFFLSAVYRVE